MNGEFRDASNEARKAAYDRYVKSIHRPYPVLCEPVSFERWCAVNAVMEWIQDERDEFRRKTKKP